MTQYEWRREVAARMAVQARQARSARIDAALEVIVMLVVGSAIACWFLLEIGG